MSKKTFSEQDIEILSKNKYVKNVSEKSITYTNEFKIHFLLQNIIIKNYQQIFLRRAGFDINIIGLKRIKCASSRWRTAYKENGVLGMRSTQGEKNRWMSRQRELTKDELIAKQNAEIEYLKAEVELLKKLELHERQARKKDELGGKAFILNLKE